jgi:eukaryotic-like serine/threonine-protein kinase
MRVSAVATFTERELLDGVIRPRYQIVRVVGSGGAGIVFLCRDTGLHRTVAIKPDNVLVSGDDDALRVQLSDFGIAAVPLADRGLTNRLFVGGSPPLMAPDQAVNSLDADQRSDIYSLGVVGYYLLAGVLPFDTQSVSTMLRLQREEGYVPLTSRRPDAPRDMVLAVERCLAVDPERRWPTATAFREALVFRGTRSRGRPLRSLANRLDRARRHVEQWLMRRWLLDAAA